MFSNRSLPKNQLLAETLQRLRDSIRQLEALASSADSHREAMLFFWERTAWAAIELAEFWVFEKRLGVPRKETESFDILARNGIIGIDIARKLRYSAEFRHLSRRNDADIDWSYLSSPTSAETALLREWADRVEREFKELGQ